MDSTYLTRVVLENYRSIAACDVKLGPLTFLVGPNGAGKSNFLDALRFVSESLQGSLDAAFEARAGIKQVLMHAEERPSHFGMLLEFQDDGAQFSGHYAFQIATTPEGSFTIRHERCVVKSSDGKVLGQFVAKAGRVLRLETRILEGKLEAETMEIQVSPLAFKDRLSINVAAGMPPIDRVYDSMRRMGFYNINPHLHRAPMPPDTRSREILVRDGSNLPGVIARLRDHHGPDLTKVKRYLERVVPGMAGVNVTSVGPYETLEFIQALENGKSRNFYAASVSDGTLRALGVLTALFQPDPSPTERIPVVGIEEPEAALHPAAGRILLQALQEASEHRQILVTSHSPELLDNKDIPPEALLAVTMKNGVTQIGPVDEVGREVLREHLYTPGEALRQNMLNPDPASLNVDASNLILAEGTPDE